jgi:ribosomal protein L31
MKSNKRLRFVIVTDSLDGIHTKHYKEITKTALKQLNETLAISTMPDYTKEDVEKLINTPSKMNTLINPFGEAIHFGFAYVGDCKICKAKSERLHSLNIQLKNHDTKSLNLVQVDVCSNCLNGYEVGRWKLVKKGGKIKVKKETFNF